MNLSEASILAPALVWLCSLVLVVMPEVAILDGRRITHAAGLSVLMGLALVFPNGTYAYATLALLSVVHAVAAARTSRTAAVSLGVTALACLVAAWALWFGQSSAALVASLVAIAVRCGLFPFHAGVADLCDKLPRVQAQQMASLVVLVFLHLRFVDHTPEAYSAAIPVVLIGAASMLAFGLISLAQRNLAGLFRASTLMHGGMLFAAVGASGRGHYAAALIVAITMAFALTGFSIMLSALVARSGALDALQSGGRAQAFPRMAASLAVFWRRCSRVAGHLGFHRR